MTHISRFSKSIEEKTRDELIEQIKRLQDTLHFTRVQKQAQEEAYLKRLSDYRKAKALANSRADKAEAAMRSMLDNFGETK
tara:strand:- start:606 stop:848 length:243 start_codon:yes stop_codon:yes gene_type:complete